MTAPMPRWSLLVAVATSFTLVALGPAASARAVSAERDDTCREGGSSARATGGRRPDTSTFTAEELREVERELRGSDGWRTTASARIEPAGSIDVHVHVVGSEAARGPTRKRVNRQMSVLQAAYTAGQSSLSAVTGITFIQSSFERVRNSQWHRASPGSIADRQMRRELHRGGRDALNVYVLAPRLPRGAGSGTLLGWSTLPWELGGGNALQDGITVHKATLPGSGSGVTGFRGFDSGDTLVHEAGHWLGLLHTFEGGCTEQNDGVEDTPAQETASIGCAVGTDTCDLPGEDPVRNFMDYSPDECMDMFTLGQVERMAASWAAYRAPTT